MKAIITINKKTLQFNIFEHDYVLDINLDQVN